MRIYEHGSGRGYPFQLLRRTQSILDNPNERLQTCCPCIEETNARIHGFTDKTHLAYAAAYNSRRLTIHYFLTTDEELPHLNLRCKRKCNLDAPEIVNPYALRALLLER